MEYRLKGGDHCQGDLEILDDQYGQWAHCIQCGRTNELDIFNGGEEVKPSGKNSGNSKYTYRNNSRDGTSGRRSRPEGKEE